MEIFTEWHWGGLAAILITLELLLGTSFFLLWVGLSAAIVAVLVWLIPTLSWQIQCLIFAVESVACVGFWHGYLKNRVKLGDGLRLNRRNEQYLGRIFVLDEPLKNGVGQIKVDDSTWRVQGPDLPKGQKVRVTGVNGVILIVEPFSDTSSE